MTRLFALLFALILCTSASAKVPHYDLDIRFSPASGTLQATVTIHLGPGTEHGFFLARSLNITSLTGQHAEVTSQAVEQPLPNLHLITARTTGTGDATMTVTYEGRIGSWRPNNLLTADVIELTVDSFWLPFSARFASPMTLSGKMSGLPADSAVITPITFTQEGDGIRFERTAPMADFPFIASPKLKSVREGNFNFHAVDLEAPISKFYREHGTRGMVFLENALGSLRHATGALIVIPRPEGTGYSRPGHIVVGESTKLDNPFGLMTFTAHELAHGWFSQSQPFSEDHWLNEAPAEYMGMLYAGSVLGSETLDKFVARKRERAAKAGALLGRGRVSDREIYDKGPVLLFDLEQKIGREKLIRVLADFSAGQEHTTRRFLDLLAQNSTPEIAAEFEQSLR